MKINSSGNSKLNIAGKWHKTADFTTQAQYEMQPKIDEETFTQETRFTRPPAPKEGYEKVRQFLQQLSDKGENFPDLFSLWAIVWDNFKHLTSKDMRELQPVLKDSGLAADNIMPNKKERNYRDPTTFQGPF